MKELTRMERAFLENILESEKEKAETFLENDGESLAAHFVRTETLPLLESILEKIEL
jgi:hypothetical protein